MDVGDDSLSLPYLNLGRQDWSIHKQVLLINIYIHLPLAGTHSSGYSPLLLLEIVPVGGRIFLSFWHSAHLLQAMRLGLLFFPNS